MSKPKELILHEIEQAPDELLQEVLDFIQFLKQRSNSEKFGVTLASESALQNDWLRPEKDEAWQHL